MSDYRAGPYPARGPGFLSFVPCLSLTPSQSNRTTVPSGLNDATLRRWPVDTGIGAGAGWPWATGTRFFFTIFSQTFLFIADEDSRLGSSVAPQC